MVSSARLVIACFFLLSITHTCALSQTVPEKVATATISGKVTLKGNGVSGIVVGLILNDNHRSQNTRNTATTGEDGTYRLTNIEPGNYEISVAAPAYVAGRRPLIISKADAIENVDFALVRGGVITGKVTDSEGRPIIETNVSVTPIELEAGIYTRSGVRTDDRGIYRAFGLRAGKYRIAAGQDEMSSLGDRWSRSEYRLTYHPAAAEASGATLIEVAEGGEVTNVDVTLGSSAFRYSASGRVIDGESGKPVAGVTYGVEMFAAKGSGGSRIGGVATNKNGEFNLQNLAPGSYAFLAEPPPESDWRIESLRFQIVDQDVTGLEVKTSRGGSVSGVIVLDGAESRAIPHFGRHQMAASTTPLGGSRNTNRSARVTPDGGFSVRGLPAGTVHLFVFGPDRVQVVRVERDGVTQARGIEVKELEQITGVRVVVDYANGSIRGTVKLANGVPPEGAMFALNWKRVGEGANIWNGIGSVRVDARGQFVADNLLPGTYEVQAFLIVPSKEMNGRSFPQLTQQVVVTGGNVTNVTLTIPQQ